MGTQHKAPGAKSKPVKKANGRPRLAVSDEVYQALREPTLRAIAVLADLLDSPDERTQLLAAKALAELGSRPPPPPVEDPNAKPAPHEIRVRYSDPRAVDVT